MSTAQRERGPSAHPAHLVSGRRPVCGRRLAADAEAVCRTVAPELAGRPLYVLLPSQLPPELRGSDGTLACTMRHLDLIVRPTLERFGRWRGRGPAMVIDPAEVASAAARRPRESRRRSFPPSFLSVVLHELAHILDVGLLGEAEPPAGLIEFGRRLLAAEAAGELPPSNGHGAPVPWRWHEWRFIRIATHLAHRATRAGEGISPVDIIDTAELGLSPTWQYVETLGDEPERMASQDFATIRVAPPPRAFAAVWRRDLLRWLLPVKSRDELSMALAACGRRIFIPKVAPDARRQAERQGSRC